MAISVVQHKSGFSSNATSLAVAFASNNASGNLLIIATGGDATLSIATDNNSNTYALAKAVTGSGGSGNARIDFVKNCRSGACTVTGHQSSSLALHLHIWEISGCDITSPLDQSGSVASSAVGAVSTGGATINGNEIDFGFFYDSPNNRTLTVGTGYTTSEQSNNSSGGDCALSETQVVTSVGIQTATCGGNSTDVLAQLIATFSAASAFQPDEDFFLPPEPWNIDPSVTVF